MSEPTELFVEVGSTVAVCPHCGRSLTINVGCDGIIEDVTNYATTAMGIVTAGNIIRQLLRSGQVPPDVLEDVQRCDAVLTAAAGHLSGGF